MNDARSEILNRVREALRAPTKLHRTPTDAAPPAADLPDWLPPVGPSYEDRLALMQDRSAALKTEFFVTTSVEDAATKLRRIEIAEGWRSLAVQSDPLVEAVAGSCTARRLSLVADYDRQQLEECDAGVTACDAIVAQTGSVLLTCRSAGGRVLSVLPPHHVVVARKEQLIADLPQAFALLAARYGGDWPSFMTLITGPSRTGDIERILVLGAHGPKRLTVFLVE
jgi:L-lactate dehydrogenase complex protein LldG